MKQIAAIILLLVVNLCAIAQTKMSPSAQFVAYKSQKEKKVCKGEPEKYIPATIRTADSEELEQLGVVVGTHIGDWMTALVPIYQWEKLVQIPSVSFITAGGLAYPQLDKALPQIGYCYILEQQSLPFRYTGKGVVVGVIDIGFQWNHMAFSHADGTTRIVAAWNQNDTTGTPPDGYRYGSLYDTHEEILAAPSCRAEIHATHVASIAAGSAWAGTPYGGIAREAELVFVEAMHTDDGGIYDTGIIDGINYICNYARSQGKPCVINLSIGGHFGPHDGTSPFDIMCDSLQGAGVLIVGAMGNQGQYTYHVGHNFDNQEKLFRTGMTQSNNSLPQVDIWSQSPIDIAVELYHESNDSLLDTSDWIPRDSLYETTLQYQDQEIHLVASTMQYDENKHYNTMFYVEGTTTLSNLYFAIAVRGESGEVDMWCNSPGIQFGKRGHADWKIGNGNKTLMEVGGTGKRITSVGAYVTNTSVPTITGGEYGVNYTLYAAAPFSSMGYTRDNRMKPEVSAPGCIITAAYNEVLAADDSNFFRSMTVDSCQWRNAVYYYGANSGTSMAAPIVTGTYALWLQADATLTPEGAKELLSATSIQDMHTTLSSATGYGKIDAYNGLKVLLEKNNENSLYAPPTSVIYPSVGNGNFAVSIAQPTAAVMVEIYTASGCKIYHKNIDNAAVQSSVELSVPSQERGIYFVKVTTRQGSHTHRYIKL